MGYVLFTCLCNGIDVATIQPWTVKYRRAEESGSVQTAHLHSPNDHIRVQHKDSYELLEVGDSLL